MAYGSGGKKTSELIDELIVTEFSNEELNKLNDGAYISTGKGRFVFTTDSFVVKPLFFPGGDIGKLSVCGTVNDISVCGGVPKYLSLSLIIEEGFLTADLRKIIKSIKSTAKSCGAIIVTGDTKVVERGHCDGIYINTSGIGIVDDCINLGIHRIEAGDKVIISGTIGDHGLAVLSAREGLFKSHELKSDCAPLFGLTSMALEYGQNIKVMRDPTRGGVATTLKEFVEGGKIGIKIYNDLIPVKKAVRAACDILGIDPLYAANEGKLIIICSPGSSKKVLDRLKESPMGKDCAVIGEVVSDAPGKLLLDTGLGSVRMIDKLWGMQLPRIC